MKYHHTTRQIYYAIPPHLAFFFFFFNDTATTEIYTLSLHDALPICRPDAALSCTRRARRRRGTNLGTASRPRSRSEEHTSELQSRRDLVCRLLLEKKKKKKKIRNAQLDDMQLGRRAISHAVVWSRTL